MLQKMWQKKWMNLSLLLGCILLIAIAVSFPLYQKAAYDRMLMDEFEKYMGENGNWPMVIHMTANCQRDNKGTIGRMEDFSREIYDRLGVPEYETIYYYSILRGVLTSEYNREDAQNMALSLSAMTELEDHARITAGEMYSESGIGEDGCIEVIVPQITMTTKELLLGEKLTYDSLVTADGDPISIRVVGVYTGNRTEDFYFQENPEKMFDTCMMKPELFKEMFTGENASKYNITVNIYNLPDYRTVHEDQVGSVTDATVYLTGESPFRKVIKAPDYKGILDEYELKINRISQTLLILQIPVLVLLAAFLLMISGQMYEMEKNEISVIKSRGSSRAQILRLYVYQGLVITVAGALAGVPLGAFFARLLGSTRNFLEFDLNEMLDITYTSKALYFTLGSMLITLLCISIPAIGHSRVSIVNLKQHKSIGKKRLWEKLFLDVVLISVSLYGYYSFRTRLSDISQDVLSGKSLDPLLYISSSFFIVGCGLLFLRIQPFVVRLIYLILRGVCGPAGFISFMENIKNSRKMQLIQLFLIMTISLGMFHATVARTILENAVDNTEYVDGADVVLMERWNEIRDENGTPTGIFIEPDTTKYMDMDFAKGFTRVYYDDEAYIRKNKNQRTPMTLMGIHTKEFGELTELSPGLNNSSYHELLNELANTQDGVLLSRNFESIEGIKIGDRIDYYNGKGKALAGTVVDFVDYFPTYSPKVTVIGADGNATEADNFLIITHFSYMKKTLGTRPYEVWISLKEGATGSDVYEFVENNNLLLTKYVNRPEDMEKTLTDPLLQGTNGVLTLGFVVTILLCAVGYLIYWILSIRERELIFGVLRACGFHRSEIVKMIIIEQIFSGVFSVMAGIGIGRLTSDMFVPILQASYATSDQILPMRLITEASDMYRLYGIVALVMIVSICTLIALLFRMNVTGALKLGEE